jgi:hypothetical protein
VLKAHAFIADDFPGIHSWMFDKIQAAVQEGWLNDS